MDVSHQERGTERFFFIGNLDAGGKDSGYFPVAFGITVYPQLNGPMLIWRYQLIHQPVPSNTGAITGPIFKHSVVIAYTLVMFTLISWGKFPEALLRKIKMLLCLYEHIYS
jgi:hypothetical protein